MDARRLDALFAEKVLGFKVEPPPSEILVVPQKLAGTRFRGWSSAIDGWTIEHTEGHIIAEGGKWPLPKFTESLEAASAGMAKLEDWTFVLCRPHSGNAVTVVATDAIGARPYPPSQIPFELGLERETNLRHGLGRKWITTTGPTLAHALVLACLFAVGVPSKEIS